MTAVAVWALLAATPAHAIVPVSPTTPLPPATVSVHTDESGTVASFKAADGQANRLTITAAPVRPDGTVLVTFTDLGAPLLTGAGCQAIDEHSAVCTATKQRLNVELGDRNDTVATAVIAAIDAGTGDDTIVATDAVGRTMSVLSGGTGDDRIDASDGGRASILGGPGDDTLTGSPGDDEIYGDGGNDTIKAGAGSDDVSGNAGADHLTCGAGADAVGLDNDDVLDHPMAFSTSKTRLRIDCEELVLPVAAGAYSLFPEGMALSAGKLTIGSIESPAKPGLLEARDRSGRLLARGPLNRERVGLTLTPHGRAKLKPGTKTAVLLSTSPSKPNRSSTTGPGVKVLLEIGPKG